MGFAKRDRCGDQGVGTMSLWLLCGYNVQVLSKCAGDSEQTLTFTQFVARKIAEAIVSSIFVHFT